MRPRPRPPGTAALVMQAYANAHGGAMPSPALVERIIVSTAQDLGAPADHQGAGLVNALKAVQLAQSIGTGSAGAQGNTLLVDQPQLSATLDAGQSQTFRVGVTNEGNHPQTITPSLSGLPTTSSSDTGSVTLASASPTFVDGEGNTDPYMTHTFTVAPGADYLNGDITWNAARPPAATSRRRCSIPRAGWPRTRCSAQTRPASVTSRCASLPPARGRR